MSLIKFQDVNFSFGANSILENVNFQINPGEKVGIVGNNGAGKTTLFRLITGELFSDSGEVTIGKDVVIGYMEQHPLADCTETLFNEMDKAFTEIHSIRREMERIENEMEKENADLEKLTLYYGNLQETFEKKGGYQLEYKISHILLGIGFDKADYNRSITEFSGGEKNRVRLAKLLLSEPDILLLDEPTNHLDIEGINWLENFLAQWKKTVVIISHDRYFLDSVTNRTLELENRSINRYRGNYSAYIQQKTEQLALQEKLYMLQKADIEKKQEFIRRNIAGQKTKQAKSRIIELEKMKKIAAPTHKINYRLSFNDGQRGGNDVLYIEDVSKSFENRTVISSLNYLVRKGDKIGIIGANGSGKTTLLKMIIGELPPDSGNITLGSHIDVGYFSQNLENQNPENTIIEEVWPADPKKTMQEMRSYLAKFLFYDEDVFAVIKNLSGGERSRVELAKLILSGINFLILDEPTNHLDIFAKMALEESLCSFTGTILVVSHDRYFLDKITNRIMYLEDGKYSVFEGNYSEFWQNYKQTEEHNSKGKVAANSDGRQKYQERKKENREKERSARKREPQVIESEIEAAEKRIAELDILLQQPDIFSDFERTKKIDAEYKELSAVLEKLYEEWENTE
ncbi:MAG: ABC-F family ATP-binding cassette domain-containing protein [Spirochaetales bacterium]|nr:ABC-F family ATP-binding cassette domain-containing protein [Spirochaetales bacterium]